MSKGTVKYFSDSKGWGFIASDYSEHDVYVHYTAIEMDGYRTLREGQQVLYDLVQTDNGLRAARVIPAP